MNYLNFLWKRHRFSVIAVVLLLINSGVIFFTDLNHSRQIRLFSTASFLLFYLVSNKKYNVFILVILLFFLGKDTAIQGYESYVGNILYLLFGILVYGTVILECFQKIRNIEISSSLIFMSVLLVAANTYALYVILDKIDPSFQNVFQIILFYTYGAFMMLMAIAAVAYNNLYDSKRSFIFILSVFSFVISDVSSLFAYYYEIDFCYYIDRISYILGFVFFVNYGLNLTLVREEKEQLELLSDTSPDTPWSESDAVSISEAKASLLTYTNHKNTF